ncbi:MAG TPA: Nif3-like dinuclear metal center hexameric protein [Methanocorpusculum sp.]|nr:Nif3-like dinuclear metal center hexameric protein [Methanocorpusculum sp.]HJK80980.1 Nif3-like dinuclear metal center hexameric protein [Methanocorpusculum sp.]
MITADLIAQLETRVPPVCSLPGDEPQFFGSAADLAREIDQVSVLLDYYPGLPLPDPADLLVVHHPPKTLPSVPVYVLHSGWDIVPSGAADALADLFGLTNRTVLDKLTRIGRIGILPDGPVPLETFAGHAAELLGLSSLRIAGVAGDSPAVETLAVVSGFGLNPSLIRKASDRGADVYLSGDLTHPGAILAHTLRLPVLDATHHATELPGLYRLCDLITSCGVPAEVYDTGIPWEERMYHDNY